MSSEIEIHRHARAPVDVVKPQSAVVSVATGKVVEIAPPTYEGEYEVTPTDSPTVVRIGGKVAKRDITVAPIPSNYGRIVYDGSALTII